MSGNGVVNRVVTIIDEERIENMLELQGDTLDELNGINQRMHNHITVSETLLSAATGKMKTNTKKLYLLRKRLDKLFIRVKTLKSSVVERRNQRVNI